MDVLAQVKVGFMWTSRRKFYVTVPTFSIRSSIRCSKCGVHNMLKKIHFRTPPLKNSKRGVLNSLKVMFFGTINIIFN